MATLESFCVAFNAAFPLVEFLYECNPNPFLTKEGDGVDLSGARASGRSPISENSTGPAAMGPDTSIKFSFPSMEAGDTDASGLCTIRLLAHLEVRPSRIDSLPT